MQPVAVRLTSHHKIQSGGHAGKVIPQKLGAVHPPGHKGRSSFVISDARPFYGGHQLQGTRRDRSQGLVPTLAPTLRPALQSPELALSPGLFSFGLALQYDGIRFGRGILQLRNALRSLLLCDFLLRIRSSGQPAGLAI